MKSQGQFARSDESVERLSSSGPISEMTSLGQDILNEWRDLLKATPKSLETQFTGAKTESPMHEGEEVSFNKTQQETIEATPGHLRYVRQEIDTVSIEAKRKEETMNRQQVAEIQNEIKQLIEASEEMALAFKDVANQVTVSKMPETSSKYQVGFFEWVLTSVRQARARIENGSAWLAAFSNKQAQKGYWGGKVKSGGFTNVHMSKERSVVTQSG